MENVNAAPANAVRVPFAVGPLQGSHTPVDGQTVCMLLSLAVILHALLDIVFLESLRLTPNPFLTPSSNFSAVDYLVLVYPLLELVTQYLRPML